jgi:hypothetical protein
MNIASVIYNHKSRHDPVFSKAEVSLSIKLAVFQASRQHSYETQRGEQRIALKT